MRKYPSISIFAMILLLSVITFVYVSPRYEYSTIETVYGSNVELDAFHRNLKAMGEGAKDWVNRYSQVEYLGGNTFELEAAIGPQVVKHKDTKEFVDFYFVENPEFASEMNCRVFAQNSHVAIEVYDFYVKLFDPDYETVSIHDERFEVQYLFKENPERWRSADYYNPKIEVIPLEDGVEIKKTFDTDYGSESLEISYIIRTGAFLKHNIVFINKATEQRTFRVVMKMAGITTNKVKHKLGEETITNESHIITPFMFFGDDDQSLRLSEYLWSLGVFEGEDNEIWTPTTLKDIILDTHAQGSKADIIIGNYELAENERLEIDPASSTWYVDSSSNDVSWVGETGDLWGPLSNYAQGLTSSHNNAGYTTASTRKYKYSGMRWTSVTIPQGATINSASLEGRCNQDDSGGYTRIYGEDENTTSAFTNDVPNFRARPRTSEYLNWDPGAWVSGTWYTSPDISNIIQEIVDRPGWSDGNSIVLFRGWRTNSDVAQRFYSYDSSSESAPRLHVNYTGVSAPSVTTLSATLVEETTANPRGEVTDTGGENPTRYIDYGETPGGGGHAVSKYLVATDGDNTGLRSKGQQKIIYSSDKSKIWLFYSRDGGRLVVLQSIDDGESWSSVYTSPADHAYAIALKDSSNYIHLILRDEANDYMEHWKSQSADDPTSWTVIDGQICDGNASGSPGADIDSNDNIHVILDRTSNHQLYYVHYNGSVWSSPLQITEGGASSYQERWSRVTVDSNGHLHIPVSVWSGSNYVKTGYIKYNGTSWTEADGTPYSLPIDLTSEIEDVTSGNSVRPKCPVIQVDDNDYPMMAIQQNKVGDSTYGEELHFYRWNGGSWVFVTVDDNANREFRLCGMIKNSVDDDELLIVLTAREELTETYHNAAYYYSDDKGATWDSIQYVTTDAETFSEHYNFHGVHLLAEPDFIWAIQRGQTSSESIFFIEVKIGDGYLYSKNCGVGGTGIYNSDLTGLTRGEKYYYRARAVNTEGTDTGSEMNFITKPNAPTNLNAYDPDYEHIHLSWTKGTGAYYTYVRRKVGSYPTSVSDGDSAYAGMGTGTTDSGLSPGVHYFYRAWSRSYDGGWGPYSDGYSSDDEYTLSNTAPINDACDSDSTFDVDTYGWVNQTVTDEDGVADLKTVDIQVTTADSKTFNLRWTQSTNVFSETSDPDGICTLDAGGSQRVNIDSDTDRIEFKFKISAAAQKGSCSVQATVIDDADEQDQDNYPNEFSINFYVELSITDGTHAWSGLSPGDDDVLITSPGDGDIDLTMTTNADFDIQAKGDGALATNGYTIPLVNVEVHKDTLGSALGLTTGYVDIGGLTSQTRGVGLPRSFKLWITVPSPLESGEYSYSLSVQGVESA